MKDDAAPVIFCLHYLHVGKGSMISIKQPHHTSHILQPHPAAKVYSLDRKNVFTKNFTIESKAREANKAVRRRRKAQSSLRFHSQQSCAHTPKKG